MMPEYLYIARVKWLDSTSVEGWQPVDVIKDTINRLGCETIGFVLTDDDRGMVIAPTLGDNGSGLGAVCIPRVAILSVDKL